MPGQVDFHPFLETPELAELGPGPREGVQTAAALQQQLKPLFKQSGLSAQRQELIHALVLLWHDHLDEAHTIAQGVDNSDGAFVHGMMHRREPDFGNAAYWFRRVGAHPAFVEIASQCAALSGSAPESTIVTTLVRDGHWDPFAFINACATARDASRSNEALLRQVQKIEFRVLLESLAQTTNPR